MPLLAIDSIATINRQRKESDIDKVNELAQSIKANGLLHPVVIRLPMAGEETAGRPYVLVVGGRRLAAHILLGEERIEATLKSNLDPLSAEVCELDENLKRVNITWQEEIEAKSRIHAIRQLTNPFQTLEETANEIGQSVNTVSRDLALAEMLKEDPSLKSMTSKTSAIRGSVFKKNIAAKVKAASTVDLASLRSKLHIMDAVDYARSLPAQSVDLVFTDLPYGIDQFENQSSGDNHEGFSKFDDHKDTVLPFVAALVPEIVRVVKPSGWICLFMSYEHHAWLMKEIERTGMKPELPPWMWYRSGSANWGHWPDRHAANRYEPIVVVNGGSALFTKKPLENVLNFEAVANADKQHNHQKPHALCRELIERFTVPGDLVVDFCFGSGAHLAAAADLGRKFAGSESNPAMLEPAIALVSQYHKSRV